MTPDAQSTRRRPTAFVPVPLRGRADGWTPARQAEFIGRLIETGSVAKAARAVGMTRETAYRLRRKPGAESFAHAWDRALGRAGQSSPKVTLGELRQRALAGVLKPLMRNGRFVRTAQRPDNTALLRFLERCDRLASRVPASEPGECKKPREGVGFHRLSPR